MVPGRVCRRTIRLMLLLHPLFVRHELWERWRGRAVGVQQRNHEGCVLVLELLEVREVRLRGLLSLKPRKRLLCAACILCHVVCKLGEKTLRPSQTQLLTEQAVLRGVECCPPLLDRVERWASRSHTRFKFFVLVDKKDSERCNAFLDSA